jgi:hypothetical protein
MNKKPDKKELLYRIQEANDPQETRSGIMGILILSLFFIIGATILIASAV